MPSSPTVIAVPFNLPPNTVASADSVTAPPARVKLKHSVRDYWLLLVIVLAIAQSAFAGQWANETWDGRSFVRQFMGIFLMIFALPKVFDLRGFAHGFQMYDLIGKRCRPYALIYPFIELALGLACQTNWFPGLTNAIVFVVMSVGATGVLAALHKGLDVTSAHLGTCITVPLTTIAVVENAGLAVLAGGLLLVGPVG